MVQATTIYGFIGLAIGLLISVTIWVFARIMANRWNVPVVIFRYTGDRRRPLVITTRGKKEVIDNCVQLKVKGYNRRFRDFQSGNYYPSPGVPFGAVVAFEFEDGWLTPLQPALKKLTREERIKADEHIRALQFLTKNVEFNYDSAVHDTLKLNMIDDVDSESYLIDQTRIRQQYQGALGWLATHGTTIVLVVIAICLTVGFVLWLREPPMNAAQMCVGQLREVCKDAWNITIQENKDLGRKVLESLSSQIGGTPPG